MRQACFIPTREKVTMRARPPTLDPDPPAPARRRLRIRGLGVFFCVHVNQSTSQLFCTCPLFTFNFERYRTTRRYLFIYADPPQDFKDWLKIVELAVGNTARNDERENPFCLEISRCQ